jgi:hypothetical protein
MSNSNLAMTKLVSEIDTLVTKCVRGDNYAVLAECAGILSHRLKESAARRTAGTGTIRIAESAKSDAEWAARVNAKIGRAESALARPDPDELIEHALANAGLSRSPAARRIFERGREGFFDPTYNSRSSRPSNRPPAA